MHYLYYVCLLYVLPSIESNGKDLCLVYTTLIRTVKTAFVCVVLKYYYQESVRCGEKLFANKKCCLSINAFVRSLHTPMLWGCLSLRQIFEYMRKKTQNLNIVLNIRVYFRFAFIKRFALRISGSNLSKQIKSKYVLWLLWWLLFQSYCAL